MEPIWKGKQTNKTSNMCASDKGKQTNKQAEAACVEARMQGAVWSCVTCGVRYAMCQSMQKSFRDASEKHGVQYAGLYSDTTLLHQHPPLHHPLHHSPPPCYPCQQPSPFPSVQTHPHLPSPVQTCQPNLNAPRQH